jgi:hypothetical protein
MKIVENHSKGKHFKSKPIAGKIITCLYFFTFTPRRACLSFLGGSENEAIFA